MKRYWSFVGLAGLLVACGSSGGSPSGSGSGSAFTDLSDELGASIPADVRALDVNFDGSSLILRVNYAFVSEDTVAYLQDLASKLPDFSEGINREIDLVNQALNNRSSYVSVKGHSNGETFLTGCAYSANAVSYPQYQGGAQADGVHVDGTLNCEEGIPFLVEQEIVSALVSVDGVLKTRTANGEPYDGRPTSIALDFTVPQGDIHSCYGEVRLQTVMLLGFQLPFSSVTEMTNNCYAIGK